MKAIPLLVAVGATLSLSSCSLLRSAVQVPLRTLQGVGRGIGVGLEYSEEQAIQESADADADAGAGAEKRDLR